MSDVLTNQDRSPSLQAIGLVKQFGRVTALNGADLELYPGEVLGVIGDNGAGKSSLIKCLSGAMIPDAGEMYLSGERLDFKEPKDSQRAGIETVYQTLAVAPALDISTNMFLGRERRRAGMLGSVFRMVDKPGMRRDAKQALDDLGIGTLQDITPGRRNALGRSTSSRRCRPGSSVRQQGRDPR